MEWTRTQLNGSNIAANGAGKRQSGRALNQIRKDIREGSRTRREKKGVILQITWSRQSATLFRVWRRTHSVFLICCKLPDPSRWSDARGSPIDRQSCVPL